MTGSSRIVTFIALSFVAAACSDPTITVVNSSPTREIPGVEPLNAAKVAELRKFDEGGCAVSAPDSGGVMRVVAIHRKALPFKVPAIRVNPQTGRGDGRAARLTVKQPDGTPVTLDCWLPKTVGLAELAKSIQDSKDGWWNEVFAQLAHARAMPDRSQREALSREAQALRGEVATPIGKGRASLNEEEICHDVTIVISYYSPGVWNFVVVTFTLCITEGGGDGYWWAIDNGYGQYAFMVVQASRQVITQLDTVTFTAQLWSSSASIPYALGWVWATAGGDSWTQACSSTESNCKIRVHGSGRMYFAMIQEDEYYIEHYISGNAEVYAAVPEHVPDEVGDSELGDGGYLEGDFSGDSVRLSGPFALEPVLWPSGPISNVQSQNIAMTAALSPEWRYTQGCAKCGPEPRGDFTEPAVDYANRFGDCSDFVFVVVKSVLGASWMHGKTITTWFNTYDSTQLADSGYFKVDSATVRAGDVVLYAEINGGGHVGVFWGWGAGGHPIGVANNGLPALENRLNVDNRTGRFDFKSTPGYVTKFFRPLTP